MFCCTSVAVPCFWFNICRLKLLSIYNVCMRTFWALWIRRGLWPRNTPPLERAARQSCHSCFSACAVLRQQCASLLLTSFKAVCSWPASKCEQPPVLLGGSSGFELMGDRWWELGWSCELFQTSEPLNGDLPSWPQGSRYTHDDCRGNGIGIMSLLSSNRKMLIQATTG